MIYQDDFSFFFAAAGTFLKLGHGFWAMKEPDYIDYATWTSF